MKCLILAAGYATRLYPLTENFPKPLLKVKDKTILDWMVDDIDTLGEIDEFVVISNHKFAHHFEKWAKEKKQKITGVDDGTSSNETRLGAVKDIEFALRKLNIKDDILVIAGDNLLDFSLTEFIKYAKIKNASCIMRYFEPDAKKLLKCGVVTIDEDDKLVVSEKDFKAADMEDAKKLFNGNTSFTYVVSTKASVIGTTANSEANVMKNYNSNGNYENAFSSMGSLLDSLI